MIGRTIGHYQIVEEIGSGGMGVVYKARDLHLDRFVALKTLPPDKVADAERKARFVREAKAASALNHPNIIHIYDITEDAGVDFIAMEYVEGKTIDLLIGRRGLRLNDALKYAIQIADGLTKAHSEGIVHRDLKPTNIMVNEDGAVKLLDFGLAKLSEAAPPGDLVSTATAPAVDERPLTEKGVVLGTVAYMSPEQAEGKMVDPRSDIFSFGSVLYEMLTGRRAFQGANKFSTISAILGQDPAPLSAEIPHDVDKTVSRCLRKDPARRFQSMADLKVALEELREESDSQNRASIASAGSLVPKRARLPMWAAAAAVIVLVAAAGIAAWFYLRARPRSSDEAAAGSQVTAGGKLRLLISSTGDVIRPALSPDGKMLAFVGETENGMDLFVRRVAGGERVRLTNDAAQEAMPNFSPDGERILYTRLGPGTKASETWSVPALGGQASHLLDNAVEARWSPDGKKLVFVLRLPGKGDALATSAADGSQVTTMMGSDATYPFFRTPSWSPDGTRLAVTRSSGGEAGELWLVPLDGKPPRRLSNDPPGIFSHWPSFTPDGKGIIHVSNRAGASNLWILPLDGGRPARLTSGAGPDDTPSVARDGSIVFINSRARSSLTLYNLADGQTREILNHSWYIWSPVFSPSRRELAFSRAEQDGSWHIWIAPLDGGAPRQLTSSALPEIYPRFTPDGESILYFTWSSGPDRIWSVPRMGGLPTALTPARDDDDQYADISPDGKWLAFGRTENKITRIYVAPLKGGDARRLTETPSTLPRWSPDGRWIAFSPARGYVDGIFLIRPDGTGMRRISGVGGWPVWWPDSKQLAFQNLGDDGSDEYRSVHLATGAIKKLTSLRFTESNHPFDISPDGSTIATVKSVVLLSDIWLLEPR